MLGTKQDKLELFVIIIQKFREIIENLSLCTLFFQIVFMPIKLVHKQLQIVTVECLLWQ